MSLNLHQDDTILGQMTLNVEVGIENEISAIAKYSYKLSSCILLQILRYSNQKYFQGSILQSSGTLENNENVANVINKSLNLLQHYQTTCTNSTAKNGMSSPSDNDANPVNGSSNQSQYQTEIAYKKLSFVYADRAYVCARAGNKIYVVQKRITEPPNIGI